MEYKVAGGCFTCYISSKEMVVYSSFIGRPQYDGLTPDTPDLMGRRIRSACSPTHSAYRYDVMGPCHDTVLCPTICIHSASSGANNHKQLE